MKCPVCRYEYTENIAICPRCSFPELGRTFVSTADADEWMSTTVNSCREVWNKALRLQVSPPLLMMSWNRTFPMRNIVIG